MSSPISLNPLYVAYEEQENSRSALETEITTLRSSSNTTETELNSLKSRISSLETSNRDTLTLLESKSTAYDKLAEELSAQHKKTVELRRDVSTLEQKLQTANSASSSARFREQNLQHELDLVRKNNEWFEAELKTKSAEYLKFRKEKSARISELQRNYEDANATVDALKRSENSLKSRLDDLEQKYDSSLSEIQQLKEEAIQTAESYRIEIDSAKRLAQLQQNAAETAKRRVQECQLTLEKTKDEAASEIARLRAEIETEHSDKEAAERRVAELEEMEAELSASRAAPSTPSHPNGAGVSSPLRPSTPVGSFSPRASRAKGGMTLTQMYAEYDRMKTRLMAEQRNNQELKATLEEMVQDLESSKPEIDELRSDHSRLEAAVMEMSNILDTAGKERDDATRQARRWQGQVEGFEREGKILRQQLRDLSCQVKVLVMEAHFLSSGETEYDREELENLVRKEMDDSMEELNTTGRLITRHLTTFKNLSELQQQNVTLRGMLRELGDKMESEEARRKDLSYLKDQEELKELRVRVDTYKHEMANLVAQTSSYIKERDTFRSMLTRRRETGDSSMPFSQSLPLGAAPPAGVSTNSVSVIEAPDYADLLQKVQAHFDSFRQETATDHSTLKQQANDLTRKNSELQSEIGRVNSQLAAAIQRSELLQSNFNLLKGENSELQKRFSNLMENSTKQDLKTQHVAEDLVEAKGLIDSIRREASNLKAEKDLWKSIEKRLVEDNESLRNERGRLESLNTDLQSLINEREHVEAESRRRLQSTVESLESELQTTKRKLDDESEEKKNATLRREFDHEQSQKRIDDLVSALSSVREDLIAVKTTRDHLQARVDELTIELKSSEEKLEALRHQPSVSAAVVDVGTRAEPNETSEGNGLSREQELTVEVTELKRDLDLARSELVHAKEQVEDYKAISQSTEERLQSLSDINDKYREDTDKLLEEKDTKISELGKRIEELSSELTSTNEELSKLRDNEVETQNKFNDQKTMLESEITRMKEQEERHNAAAQYYQQDIRAQAEIAQDAQQNYENELVKHAEAAKTLQDVRAEANRLKLEAVDLKTQAETAKSILVQQEESWSEMRARLESEKTELTRRRDEVLNQNSLLHKQLETITRQISDLQRDKAAIPEEGEGEGSSSSLEGMQEVIKFLRREKEIVDVQYHLSTQEGKRIRQQLEYTRSQLDETRLKLEQQRRAEADSENNILNHNKLMDTLNELNLFRESSVTLRSQAKQAEAALAEKTAKVEELSQKIEPLEIRIGELENLAETRDGELKLLQDDRDRWQQRTQNILHKYDRVDPAEMEALKEKAMALENLQKERDETSAAKLELEAQIQSFPEQLKKSDERLAELRQRLTDQFKARSKELVGRINGKVMELNVVVQEKEAIQHELTRTKEEVETLKKKSETPAHGSASPVTPVAAPVVSSGPSTGNQTAAPTETTVGSAGASVERIQELESKIQQLQADLAQKESEIDQKVKERVDKIKEALNGRLSEYKAQHQEEVDKLVSRHKEELEGALREANGSSEITDARAKDLVAKNETIRNILLNNIRNAVNKEREKFRESQAAAGASPEAVKELEKKFNDEKDALIKEREFKINSAVELAEKRLLAKISMTESRARNVQAKIEVVQKAATETPSRAVIEVWEIAKVAKPAPPQSQARNPTKPATAAPSAPSVRPIPAASAPVSAPAPPQPAPQPQQEQQAQPQQSQPQPQEQFQQPPQPQPSQPKPSSQPSVEKPEDESSAASPDQKPAPQSRRQQQKQASAAQQAQKAQHGQHGQQPKHPQPAAQGPQAESGQEQQDDTGNQPAPGHHNKASNIQGAAAGTLRALQSGLPVAARGRGRGGQQSGQQGGHQAQQTSGDNQQQQQAAQRGSNLPRGGRNRGGGGRGGAQNVQTSNLLQGQHQPSPKGGRGSLNANAKQFIPTGNKRARDDAEAASDGNKRARGGGAAGS